MLAPTERMTPLHDTLNGNGISKLTNDDTEKSATQKNGCASGYIIPDITLGVPRRLRVITIGAGASGLNLARQIDKHMQNVEHIIYEKNADVGGTWFENRYPGCACDIPSHNYQFTWEPNAEWNHL
jgi:NADPH-dependent glutamate synthase beta subunit-like oxidoreductase